MSYKSALSNSLKSNCDTPQWIPKTESNVKLAGEEAKDRLYEPKHKKKLVRVLTVVAYIFFVSLAAIMLSLYYVFLYPQNWQKFKDPEMAAPGQARYNGSNIFKDVIERPTVYTDDELYSTDISVLPPRALPLSSMREELPTLLEKLIARYETNYVNDTF